ncbi:MAG: hypothetical protein ACK5M4_07935 [Pseudorhodobacter sp.]
MIRPELRAALWRAREVWGAAALGVPGLWFMTLGGWFLTPLGVILIVAALVFGVIGWRRMRFMAEGQGGSGLVEVIEGQIRYFGPAFGGMVAIPDIGELALQHVRGRRFWRLVAADGILLIPIDAEGAGALFDAFASLPGLDMPELLAILEEKDPPAHTFLQLAQPETRLIWRRRSRPVLT